MDGVALGPLPLMLARRAADLLGRAGIPVEVFRDDAAYRRAEVEYAAQVGLAYLRAANFDPDAFGLVVPADRADDAVGILAGGRIRVARLEVEEAAEAPPAPDGEPSGHPYRESPEERLCVRCGEPEAAGRAPGAPCARCGGAMLGWEAFVAARRKVARRWGLLFVLGLLAFGIASPRFVSCHSPVHVGR